MLSILSAYIPGIPPVSIDGIYGNATRAAVLAAQRRFGLPETGIIDTQTWNEIYDQYSGIENTSLRNREDFPDTNTVAPMPAAVQTMAVSQARNNQRRNMRPPVAAGRPAEPNGVNSNRYRQTTTFTQFPGFDLRMDMQDPISQEVIR